MPTNRHTYVKRLFKFCFFGDGSTHCMFYDLLWNSLTGHFHSLSQTASVPGRLSLSLCPLWTNWPLRCVRCLHCRLFCTAWFEVGEEGGLTDEAPERVSDTWLEACHPTQPLPRRMSITLADNFLPSSSVLCDFVDSNKGSLTKKSTEGCCGKLRLQEVPVLLEPSCAFERLSHASCNRRSKAQHLW